MRPNTPSKWRQIQIREAITSNPQMAWMSNKQFTNLLWRMLCISGNKLDYMKGHLLKKSSEMKGNIPTIEICASKVNMKSRNFTNRFDSLVPEVNCHIKFVVKRSTWSEWNNKKRHIRISILFYSYSILFAFWSRHKLACMAACVCVCLCACVCACLCLTWSWFELGRLHA